MYCKATDDLIWDGLKIIPKYKDSVFFCIGWVRHDRSV